MAVIMIAVVAMVVRSVRMVRCVGGRRSSGRSGEVVSGGRHVQRSDTNIISPIATFTTSTAIFIPISAAPIPISALAFALTGLVGVGVKDRPTPCPLSSETYPLATTSRAIIGVRDGAGNGGVGRVRIAVHSRPTRRRSPRRRT